MSQSEKKYGAYLQKKLDNITSLMENYENMVHQTDLLVQENEIILKQLLKEILVTRETKTFIKPHVMNKSFRKQVIDQHAISILDILNKNEKLNGQILFECFSKAMISPVSGFVCSHFKNHPPNWKSLEMSYKNRFVSLINQSALEIFGINLSRCENNWMSLLFLKRAFKFKLSTLKQQSNK